MLAILLLNRLPRTRVNYAEWFADLEEEVYMISAHDVVDDFPEFLIRIPVDFFARNGQVEIEALELFARHPYRTVVALEESDIVRAGRLRSRLGIGGQSLESATAFRNKLVMKRLASAAGIPVAPFRQVDCPLDIYDFVQEHGLPVVIKPITGMFSTDTAIIGTWDQLKDWFRNHVAENVMVEAFVDGAMYHINGIVLGGTIRFVSAAAYIDTCIAYTQGLGVGSIMLAPGSWLNHRLVDFTAEILRALPTPADTTFHAEVFLTADDRMLLCEIASRTSGGGVPALIKHAYGLGLDRYIARAQCGRVDPLPNSAQPRILCGNYFVPPRNGVLHYLPQQLPFDWCFAYRPNGQVGRSYNGPTRCMQNVAEVAVEAVTEAEVRQRLEEAIAYILEHSVWGQDPTS